MARIMKIDEYNQTRMFGEHPSGMTVGEVVQTLEEDYLDFISSEFMKGKEIRIGIISKEDYDKSKKWQSDYPCIPCDTLLCDYDRNIYILTNGKSVQRDMYEQVGIASLGDIIKGLEGVDTTAKLYAEFDDPDNNRTVFKVIIVGDDITGAGGRNGCTVMFVAQKDEA